MIKFEEGEPLGNKSQSQRNFCKFLQKPTLPWKTPILEQDENLSDIIRTMGQQMPQNKVNCIKKIAALHIKQKLGKAHNTAAPGANSLAPLSECPLVRSMNG